jgi:acetyl-CoA C-acetyltransferase
MNLQDIYIIDAKRSAIGKFNGALSSISAVTLGTTIIKSLILPHKISNISQVIMGQVLTGGVGQNPARQASILAGIDHVVPAWTLNQVCGSGLRSVIEGAKSITLNDSDIVIAGGQENMSASGHIINLRQLPKMGDNKLIDTMIIDGLTDAFHNYHMGITAENVAKQYNISREDQDEFAYHSQHKAFQAQQSGKFNSQIVDINITQKKETIIFNKDESIRSDCSIEALSKLAPAFDKNGTVTAGNASGINDGAAAVLLMSGDKMRELGLKPMARIKSWASIGVDPQVMGLGPIPTIKKALKLAGWNQEDLDLIESNEAFAAQALAVIRDLDLDTNKLNVNGGAIALGHPIGASGARVLVTLLHEMVARNAKKGLAALCIGGGMGIAVCIERE